MRWFNPTDVGNSSKEGRACNKTSLNSSNCLEVARPRKAFQLFVHEKEGKTLGVLTQRLGPEPQPVAYLSKRLDPTAWGWPPCLRNLAAIAILIEDALKLSLGDKQFFQSPSETGDFPGGSDSQASTYKVGDAVLIPGLGRSCGEGNSNPLQYSCLENPIYRGTW